MSTKFKDLLSKTSWLGLASMALYLGYGALLRGINSAKYEKAFLQIQHPAKTSLVDSVSLSISYYPATYADDTIHFETANLIGELRNYGGDWEAIQNFYGNQSLENGSPIAIVPIEAHQNDKYVWLDVPDWFLSSPSHYDILEGIREQYDFWEWPENLSGITQELYLVYVLGQ